MDITQDGFEEENVEQVDNFKYPDNFSDIKGYHHLHFLCKNVRNESTAIGNESPITPRLQYIIEALSTQGMEVISEEIMRTGSSSLSRRVRYECKAERYARCFGYSKATRNHSWVKRRKK